MYRTLCDRSPAAVTVSITFQIIGSIPIPATEAIIAHPPLLFSGPHSFVEQLTEGNVITYRPLTLELPSPVGVHVPANLRQSLYCHSMMEPPSTEKND